jgi:hypothetical protein
MHDGHAVARRGFGRILGVELDVRLRVIGLQLHLPAQQATGGVDVATAMLVASSIGAP